MTSPYPLDQHGPPGRPVALWIASVLVWLTCAAYLAAGGAILYYRGRLTELITSLAGFDELWPLIETLLTTLAAPFIAIAVVIAFVGVAAFRGSNAARWAIVMIVGLGALLPLMGLIAGEINALPFFAFQVAVITLYALPACSRWYADRARRAGK